jgi:quinol-cytochrome oxidoreductase complex cytochrome b subunit
MNKTSKDDKLSNSDKGLFNEGFGLKNIIEKNITKKLIPRGLSWFGCMGGLALVAFMVQVGTGIFLFFYYAPSPGEAFNSIKYIRHALPYGWLIQKVHAVPIL